MSYMTASERQSALTSELVSARTSSLFAQALDHVAAAFGYGHFTLANAPAPEDVLLAPLVIETTLPTPFLREFDKAHLLRDCPILPRTRESALPQHWHLSDKSLPAGLPILGELRALLLRQRLPMGSVFPLNAMDGQRLVFWFNGNRNPLSQSEINELAMIMVQALDTHNSLKRNDAGNLNMLSARELEVVRWTAQGKTSVEIGQILSLSDHTVNAYMTNAIKKLDCVNRTQLVAKAIRLKLIN
ncbi:LuxR family transcriptional regulator [Rhizobium sp. BK251]|uniref:helix-turn-helix transcriptional regulator n=1 Tax=Rhizobium sp. BK251 TaxID=2512125 RepID=UPI0010490A30|nr:LuxR family transcriptional regulator [Rhizobium sp. BK251]TCL74705.1 DNA-binding CsgD family transcriptional regulator [Rhizobium sp. BK251]